MSYELWVMSYELWVKYSSSLEKLGVFLDIDIIEHLGKFPTSDFIIFTPNFC